MGLQGLEELKSFEAQAKGCFVRLNFTRGLRGLLKIKF